MFTHYEDTIEYVIPWFVYDRTQKDVDRVAALHRKGWKRLTVDEREEGMSGMMKGALNRSDLRRIENSIYVIAQMTGISLATNRDNVLLGQPAPGRIFRHPVLPSLFCKQCHKISPQITVPGKGIVLKSLIVSNGIGYSVRSISLYCNDNYIVPHLINWDRNVDSNGNTTSYVINVALHNLYDGSRTAGSPVRQYPRSLPLSQAP